ncbi:MULTISPECIES: HIRAN domain-containing protein [unclassified Methylobacterium]|uniref:HIRAN domain-containing protein n=1 Tax=unclassified Methylobacterium TaxID=2615210 RepID=UPI00226A8432|nr:MULTISPECIES: HIRAN domain-containing protein [unclassified Methylobacterium]
MSIDNGLPDMRGLAGTDAASEESRLAGGEAWFTTEIAGLQYHSYGRTDELTGERVIPLPGDRLSLVREPANPHDANAIQVWWKNGRMLGHLPRYCASELAPLLDDGVAARAYVMQPGDGEAWSLRALIVGPAGAGFHESTIRHVVREALGPSRADQRRARRFEARVAANADRAKCGRKLRLQQAVETLLGAPFDPDLLAVGEECTVRDLQEALRCSDYVPVKIARSVGIEAYRMRHHTYRLRMTSELDAALRAWAGQPRVRGRICPSSLFVPSVYPDRQEQTW